MFVRNQRSFKKSSKGRLTSGERVREEGGSPLSYGGELLPDGTESPMEERVERGGEGRN